MEWPNIQLDPTKYNRTKNSGDIRKCAGISGESLNIYSLKIEMADGFVQTFEYETLIIDMCFKNAYQKLNFNSIVYMSEEVASTD